MTTKLEPEANLWKPARVSAAQQPYTLPESAHGIRAPGFNSPGLR